MLTRTQKEEQVADLRDKFSRAKGVFIADYRGISVKQANVLRSELRKDEDVEYRVSKNTLLRRATADTDLASVSEHFNGPTAVAISFGDPARLAKILVDYSNDNDDFELKGAFLDGKAIDQGEIATLATLPSLDELRGTIVGLLQAPATKLVRLLGTPGEQVARVIQARHDALQESGDA